MELSACEPPLSIFIMEWEGIGIYTADIAVERLDPFPPLRLGRCEEHQDSIGTSVDFVLRSVKFDHFLSSTVCSNTHNRSVPFDNIVHIFTALSTPFPRYWLYRHPEFDGLMSTCGSAGGNSARPTHRHRYTHQPRMVGLPRESRICLHEY